MNLDNFLKELAELMDSYNIPISSKSKYLTAKQAETEFGINAQTLRNRSNLNPTHKRYIPPLTLNGGRTKYFDRKVLERILSLTNQNVK